MNIKLIKDAIFPKCKGKTDHKVQESNQYFYDVIGNDYVVFYVDSNDEQIEIASYEESGKIYEYFG